MKLVPTRSHFEVSGLGTMTDLIVPTVWAREPNPFRGRRTLPAGTYSCERFTLPARERELLRRVQDGREHAYCVVLPAERAGYVAVRRPR